MKKITFALMALCLSLTFQPQQVSAAALIAPTSGAASQSSNPAQADVLQLRLNEIKTTDKSTLSSSERKDLRVEKRSIKHELRSIGGGVYISAGAVIIIIILLIIFL